MAARPRRKTAFDEDDLPEIRAEAYAALDRWRDRIDETPKLKKREVFEAAAADLFLDAENERDLGAAQAIHDAVYELGRDHAGLADDDIQFVMVGAEARAQGTRKAHNKRPGGTEDEHVRLIQSSRQFVTTYIPPDYLIEGLLQHRYFYSLTGRTGSGKTAIALLLVALVALARKLGDRQCDKGRVLFLAAENPDDTRARWIAMAQQTDFDPDTIDVHFIEGPFKISQAIERITAEVKELGGVDLIVVDTSAAFFEGDDENNAVQMLAHARRLRSLTELPGGPCVLVPCHPVKNAADDNLIPRGGGSFLNESDGNLTALRDDATVMLHWQGKFRGPDFAPLSFGLRTVTHERLKDSKDRLIPTVIAEHLSPHAQEEIEKTARGDEDRVLEALAETPGLSAADLAKQFGWFMRNGDPYKSRAQRTLTRLKKDKLVALERGRHVLTEKGNKAIKQAAEAAT